VLARAFQQVSGGIQRALLRSILWSASSFTEGDRPLLPALDSSTSQLFRALLPSEEVVSLSSSVAGFPGPVLSTDAPYMEATFFMRTGGQASGATLPYCARLFLWSVCIPVADTYVHVVYRGMSFMCSCVLVAAGAGALSFCVGICQVDESAHPGSGVSALSPTFGWAVVSDGTLVSNGSPDVGVFKALSVGSGVHVLGVGWDLASDRVFFSVNGLVFWSASTVSRESMMSGRRFFVRTSNSGLHFHLTTGPRFQVPLDILLSGAWSRAGARPLQTVPRVFPLSFTSLGCAVCFLFCGAVRRFPLHDRR
jgi:hypothetical protein